MIIAVQIGQVRGRLENQREAVNCLCFFFQIRVALTIHIHRCNGESRIKDQSCILFLKETKQKRRIFVLQKPETDSARKQRVQNVTIINMATAPKSQRRHAIRLRNVQLVQQSRRSRINLPDEMQQQTPSHMTSKKRHNNRLLSIHLQTNLNRQSTFNSRLWDYCVP
jgi:hypothetical protein